MKTCHIIRIATIIGAILAAGCAGYRWTSSVPEELRTVSVAVFENRTRAAELGPTVTRHVLREFQREGTFSIRRVGDASIDVQGAVVSVSRNPVAYDRGYGMRASEYRYVVGVEVSFINRETGKVLRENVPYYAETTFLVQGDLLTGQRNAADRIAQELARQIVDDAVSYPYGRSDGK